MKKVILTDKAPKAVGPYSQAIDTDTLIFISGQLPLDINGNMPQTVADQTRCCIENIKNILNSIGLTLDNVVKTTVFMTDLSKFQEMNNIYSQYFSQNPPARSTVEVKALPKSAMVEIEAVAVKNK